MAVPLPAHQAYVKLRGVFAVYKHANVSVSSISRKILHKLCTDLNTNYVREQKKMVRFLPREEAVAIDGSQMSLQSPTSIVKQLDVLDLVPVNVPDMFDHPGVQGPRYQPEDFELDTNNILDFAASGVQVFGLQPLGKHVLKRLLFKNLPNCYRVHGRFGAATAKFDRDSKVIHKSTYEHITKRNIKAFLEVIHGSHRNALLESSGFDLESQLGYEMASKGLLKPKQTISAVVLNIKLLSLNLPDFVIDVACINESCQFLRYLIDEIGSTLKSCAVCTDIHRYKDGIFLAQDENTLLTRDVTVQKVIDVTSFNFDKLTTAIAEDSEVYDNWAERSSSVS